MSETFTSPGGGNQLQPHEILEAPFTLVLGGGGARGLAHIGVLGTLEREGIMPSLIVGSSMGAIIGAMYSQLRNSVRIQELIEDVLYSDFFANLRLDLMPDNSTSTRRHMVDYLKRGLYCSRVTMRSGAIENSRMIRILSRLLKNEDIRETQIPFAAVAVNLATGEEVVLQHGSIIEAVAASSAIPGVVTPVDIDGDQLIDGSVVHVVPIQAAKKLSSYPVLAVDVSKDIAQEAPPRTGLDVMRRADLIASRELNQLALKDADFVLAPNVGVTDWSDFQSLHRLTAAGMDVAERFLKQTLRGSEPVLVGMN